MSNSTGKSIMLLLAGTIVGAGLGILFAPQKGSKTRSKIKDGFQDAKEDLITKFDEVSGQLKKSYSDSKLNFNENLDSLISDVSYKAEDVIEHLEKKLSELKEQNAKFQK